MNLAGLSMTFALDDAGLIQRISRRIKVTGQGAIVAAGSVEKRSTGLRLPLLASLLHLCRGLRRLGMEA
ncbi:hypothetical protein GA0061102_10122 [Rhizobium miluonense]|uniref:Uncharacterized protein n=1 Tax=Rhizobium miluonense TaxID=411945 RepID=A0A1C3VEA2_9HYPH|nr:hypothetical protein GA0061102_10122 [Rhizobium miluonense]